MKSPLLWISWRLLTSRKTLFGGSAPLSLLGLVLGVAALVVSMGVMSGYESTLRQAMADVSGHVQVVKRSRETDDWHSLEAQIRKLEPTTVGVTRFTFIEAVLAHQGQISGVLIQGLDKDRYSNVLNFKPRVISGVDSLAPQGDLPAALIGKGLASRMNLQVGDTLNIVIPVADSENPSSFKRRMGKFRVQGILDLGKYEWNERFIVTDLKASQDLAQIGDRYTGLLLKFNDIGYAREAGFHLSQALGAPYWVRDWRDSNENLFEAVVIERVAIFFVVLVILFVAAFNVSSTLFVNVVQRYTDIAILKTVGMTQKSVMKMFSCQGIFIGLIGLLGGFVLGFILCILFTWAETRWGLVDGSVYKIDGIQIQIRAWDAFAICATTLVICFVATLAPARRGSRLNPVEGLRYG